MANNVFANGREISCKSGDGKSIAAFPDVCFTPPQTTVTPTGVPIPYPNTGFARDTSSGSRTVKITDKEVMLKNKSYFKTSTGDEAGNAPKKGVMTSKIKGKVYFIAWSMDVKFEGENVVRHLDMTTHNHGSNANTLMVAYIDSLSVAGKSCKQTFKKERIDVHPHSRKDCSEGYESDHILQNACFQNKRGSGRHSITACPDYKTGQAPCICLKGGSTELDSQHYKKTRDQIDMQSEWSGKKTVTYKEVRDRNLDAVFAARSKPPSKTAQACIKKIVDFYFKKQLGLKDSTPVRVPGSGRYRRPPSGPRG